ncbi:hypothetical protein BU26DRAFT_245595 [Trematosphaeria pertusa]|uniref:Secreted protein n=1 Tax=Trematosphaeria pertusa TaxID=390896 RepID=A0A6A6IMN8_9PLEO|nr:uncharacterized protein BU26DRAFT_245595 [Trematosphaeria pertusa]KAF2251835.1 hypothetical protein BU26DRAFT_245595 [Trematosphaeria pertusa]
MFARPGRLVRWVALSLVAGCRRCSSERVTRLRREYPNWAGAARRGSRCGRWRRDLGVWSSDVCGAGSQMSSGWGAVSRSFGSPRPRPEVFQWVAYNMPWSLDEERLLAPTSLKMRSSPSCAQCVVAVFAFAHALRMAGCWLCKAL